MKLDPVREARARRMVLDRSTWPNICLPMKRIVEPVEFGIIHPKHAQPNYIVISAYPGKDQAPVTFNSIDDLVAAGWTVD